jgi:pyridoxal phosphate enzyme (YggS family)
VSVQVSLLAERIEEVRARIAAAAERAGRDPAGVTLVAVTKTHGMEMIRAAYESGLRHFGENRVEEAEGKIAEARRVLPGDDVRWHMIGHVQSRKTAAVAECFDWVHSVDRFRIARRISVRAGELGRTVEALLQVNLSGEDTKSGYDLSAWPGDDTPLDALCGEVEQIVGLPHLRIRGLMTMAPYTAEPESVRPIFRRARLLREALRERFPALDWAHLSMGMTADYEVAVEEGATMVRVGTALFGPREYCDIGRGG